MTAIIGMPDGKFVTVAGWTFQHPPYLEDLLGATTIASSVNVAYEMTRSER